MFKRILARPPAGLPRPLAFYSAARLRGLRWQSSANVLAGDGAGPLVTPTRVVNGDPSLRLNITQRAAQRLGEIYRSSGEVLRVGVESGGCHGFQYNLALQPRPESQPSGADASEFDEFEDRKDIVYVLPEEQGEVVIDHASHEILNNTTLTYTTELIGSTFRIIGGKMTSSCGCGSSFDFDGQS
ncbi:ADL334Cp [Eremothecium gossypii ATCC 10895]|uniref:ADL334Cp n=1 Tax=Eremothecium gossypii (strain ATCC 10895 / CBS 109.51 / FGSC 9923 / NRRL Y-1056) TaxID=284811 RepID=Q75BA0_EREGS|nr:ADL334Cp [Eremothecium gossypii ATCC 10895]AAS51586.1 ADL334Cp [Eremothecium gossypii ATCC 10895]AEY95882.1 FADL334Cp [Eremothecium gossypii FDAG1]